MVKTKQKSLVYQYVLLLQSLLRNNWRNFIIHSTYFITISHVRILTVIASTRGGRKRTRALTFYLPRTPAIIILSLHKYLYIRLLIGVLIFTSVIIILNCTVKSFIFYILYRYLRYPRYFLQVYCSVER